jgi:hypothetical protein
LGLPAGLFPNGFQLVRFLAMRKAPTHIKSVESVTALCASLAEEMSE